MCKIVRTLLSTDNDLKSYEACILIHILRIYLLGYFGNVFCELFLHYSFQGTLKIVAPSLGNLQPPVTPAQGIQFPFLTAVGTHISIPFKHRHTNTHISSKTKKIENMPFKN